MKTIRTFNIKYRPEIESGRYKVRTASGHPVRIVCWDAKSEFNDPIVALVEYPAREVAVNYTTDGRYIGNNENYLVVETDERELSHGERIIFSVLQRINGQTIQESEMYNLAVDLWDELQEIATRGMIASMTGSSPKKEYYGQ